MEIGSGYKTREYAVHLDLINLHNLLYLHDIVASTNSAYVYIAPFQSIFCV